MGLCFSDAELIKTIDSTSSDIDSKLAENATYEKSLHKLLFLGPGGSGKSTIFHQLQWIHGNGMSDKESLKLKPYIELRVINQMQGAIRNYLSDAVHDVQLQNAINRVQSIPVDAKLTTEIANDIAYIWQNDVRLSGIFQIHHTKKVLDESTEYFWNSLERISADNYVPNKTDIIQLRNRTSGMIEKRFIIKKCNLHIFDCGGQKCERKKWFRLFDIVDAVVFVVAISTYNEMMFEDAKVNAMVDALKLFDDTIHHKMFLEIPIILFLNKKDLFEIKIKDLPITVCPAFSDFEKYDNAIYIYNDPNNYTQTVSYVKDKFKQIDKCEQRRMFIHVICATDDENIYDVFNDITSIVVKTMTNVTKAAV